MYYIFEWEHHGHFSNILDTLTHQAFIYKIFDNEMRPVSTEKLPFWQSEFPKYIYGVIEK